MRSFLRSLYFKLIGTISIILIVLGFMSFYIIQHTTKSKITILNKQLTSIFTSALGKSVLEQMLFSDPAVLQSLISSLVNDENIVFAYIINEKKEVIVHTFSPLLPDDVFKVLDYQKRTSKINTRDYGSIYVHSEPLFNGIVGYMIIGQKIPDLSNLWFRIGIITLVSFIFIALLIMFHIFRNFTHPLYHLIDQISQTDSDGIPIRTISKYSTTEFNTLGTTINNMINSISRSRKELTSQHMFSMNIIKGSPDIILGIKPEGVITFINPAGMKKIGYKVNDSIEGSWWEGLLANGDISNLLIEDLEMEIKSADGSTKYVIWNSMIRESTEGSIEEIILFGSDYTQRKLADDKLFKLNKELVLHKENLETLVKARTEELQISLDRLRLTQSKLVESEKMASLGALVAGVAHEINTPVGIGVTAASHLDTKAKRFTKLYSSGQLARSEFEDFVKVIEDSSKIILSNMLKAANLIQSFKQVAVDQSSEESREFKISEYIEEILLSTSSKFKHTNYKIEVDCPEEFKVNSYPGAISQILTNLLMNSLTHGFENMDRGTIFISVYKEKDSVKLIYKDTGKGIPKENLKKIFDPFFTTRRGLGGSGLGMHILYNLVTQSLKGHVECSSIIGKETKFTIIFPLNIKKSNRSKNDRQR